MFAVGAPPRPTVGESSRRRLVRARRSAYHSADWSRSPVRMRMAVSTGVTKILPSPMLPVLAAAATTSATLSTNWSGTTTSILIFGRKSTVYSPPRYSSVCPFCRPNPRTSDTVMPITPMPVSASLTSSSLNGLMIASIFFIAVLPKGVAQSNGHAATAVAKARNLARLHAGPRRRGAQSSGTAAGGAQASGGAQVERARSGRLRTALRDVVLAHLGIERGPAQAQERGGGLLVPARGLERFQ